MTNPNSPHQRALVCPHCGSGHVVFNGYRHTHTRGRRRRLLCRSCGRKFSMNAGSPPSLTLREQVNELRGRVEALEQSRGTNPAHFNNQQNQ